MLPTPKTTRDKVLNFVAGYAEDSHNAPSTRQIAKALKISQNRVMECLDDLEDEGRIERIDGRIKVIGAVYIPPQRKKAPVPAQIN